MEVWTQDGEHKGQAPGDLWLWKAISPEDGLSRDPSGLSLCVSLETATRLQAENLSKLDGYTLKGIQAPYSP